MLTDCIEYESAGHVGRRQSAGRRVVCYEFESRFEGSHCVSCESITAPISVASPSYTAAAIYCLHLRTRFVVKTDRISRPGIGVVVRLFGC